MKQPSAPIILASASPRRKQMFAELGLFVEVVPSHIDESFREGESDETFTRRMAQEKAQATAALLGQRPQTPWIVAADTVVVIDGTILGKPRDLQESTEMLRRLSGRTHTVVTGWWAGRAGGPFLTGHARTGVTFHALTDRQIEAYVATGEGADKAGSYAIQGLGTFLVDRIEGNYFNVVGLPISHVVRALIELGAIADFPTP